MPDPKVFPSDLAGTGFDAPGRFDALDQVRSVALSSNRISKHLVLATYSSAGFFGNFFQEFRQPITFPFTGIYFKVCFRKYVHS
jgi:hypothetical protein